MYNKLEKNFSLVLICLIFISLGLFRVDSFPYEGNVDEDFHFNRVQRLRDCYLMVLDIPLLPEPTGETCEWRIHIFRGITSAYSYIVALPTIAAVNFDTQLKIARLSTLGLGVLTILMTASIAKMLFQNSNWMPILAALFVALLPSYIDISAGVNSDSGAAFISTLLIFLFMKLRFQKKSALLIFAFFLAVLVAPFFKHTLWITFAILGYWGSLSLGKKGQLALYLALFSVAFGSIFALGYYRNEEPKGWYATRADLFQYANRKLTKRVPLTDVPDGQYAFHVTPDERALSDFEVVQVFSARDRATLNATRFEVSGYIKSTQDDVVQLACPDYAITKITIDIPVTDAWQPFSYACDMPITTPNLAFYLADTQQNEPVWYDDLRVVVPEQARNLLRNGSAEKTQFRLRLPVADSGISAGLISLSEWRVTWRSYISAAIWVFTQYWSAFSGTQQGLTTLQLVPFAMLSIIAGFGAVLALLRTNTTTLADRTKLHYLWVGTIIIFIVITLRIQVTPQVFAMVAFAGARQGLIGVSLFSILLAFGILYWLPKKWHRAVVCLIAVGLFATNILITFQAVLPFFACDVEPKVTCIDFIFG